MSAKNKIKTIKNLCDYIWHLEEKYNLLEIEINGIHPWAAFRMDLYYLIGKKYEVFDQELNMKLSSWNKIIQSFQLLRNIIRYQPKLKLKKVDVLIFSHERSKILNNKFIDPYTHYLKANLLKDKISFLEFEPPYKGKHLRKKQDYTRYLDVILILRNIKSLFVKIKLNNTIKKTIQKLSEEINKEDNKFLDVKNTIISNTKKFKPTYDFYKYILQKTQPKKIYLVVSYGKGELIKAANELNIEVIELQHGTFSKYHLGYSFPYKNNKKYLPTKFYVWNKYWKNLITLPIAKENVVLFPFQYIEKEKEKYKKTKKVKDSLIIFSQGGITESMAEKIINNIDYFKQYNMTFKLHPNEYHMISRYTKLNQLKKMHNVTIVKDIDLYKNLASFEFQAGVFSTVLYEGIEFNCKTILLDLPGIEYMSKFITKYNPKII
tara:strand:- start:3891 stop:5192 length:1302 start_codon:yes stop_codon:yes gene_type:complete